MIYAPFELHTHTRHSDGQFMPEALANAALEAGLAGLALTDHNTRSGVPFLKRAGEENGLIVLSGIELTTFYGHLTLYGTGYDTEDWRAYHPQTVRANARRVREGGGLLGIAHPFRIGYPICTGGSDDWGLGDDYTDFTHYEVWSYLSPAGDRTNTAALQRYKELLAKGNRLSCVYGRDWHDTPTPCPPYAVTFLGMHTPSEEDALAAIRCGRTYISTGLSADIILKNWQQQHTFGDTVPAGSYQLEGEITAFLAAYTAQYAPVASTVRLTGTAGNSEATLRADGTFSLACTLKEGYALVEVWGTLQGEQRLLLVSSPYYIKK